MVSFLSSIYLIASYVNILTYEVESHADLYDSKK